MAALIPAYVGFAGAMAAMRTVSKDISTALAGGRAGAMALRDMGAAGVHVVRQLRAMRFELRSLEQQATRPIYQGLNRALPRLRGALPSARQAYGAIGGAVGGLIPQAANMLTQPGTLRQVVGIAQTGAGIVSRLGSAAIQLMHAFIGLGSAAGPLATWLADTVRGWAAWVSKSVAAAQASGALQARFARIRHELSQLFEFLRNVGHTLHRVFADARPAGELLYNTLLNASRAWRQMSDNTSRNVRLTQDFMNAARGFVALSRLVAVLAGTLFKMGTSTGLPRLTNSLSQMIPVLGQVLSRMAETFGPPLAQLLGNVSKLFSLLGGPEGPIASFLGVLNSIVVLASHLISMFRPLGGIIGKALEVGLLLRFASKLGLIELGWRKVAVAAGEAAVAEQVAAGGGGGGLFGFIRPGRGLTRFIAPARGAAVDAAAAGGRLGRLGAGARLVGGAVGKIALPLALISGGLGALTAKRSGSLAWQGMQSLYGGLNAATFGGTGALLGALGLGHAYDTPEQLSSRAAAQAQRLVQTQMQDVGKSSHGIDRLTQEVGVLQASLQSWARNQTDAGRQYRQTLQDEITARRALISTLTQEAATKGSQTGGDILAQANKAYAAAGGGARGVAAGSRYALGQLQRRVGGMAAAGAPANLRNIGLASARLAIEQGLVAGDRSRATANRVVGIEAASGRRVRVAGGQVWTGGRAERDRLAYKLSIASTPAERALLEADLSASLQASGLSAAQAQADVRSFVRRKFNLNEIPRHIAGEGTGQGGFTFAHAAGGRLGGSGLHDTVSVPGGMAAPGELVVNRHTERKANYILGAHGLSLGGLVDGETTAHSARYARGGRATYHGFPAPHKAVAGIADFVMGMFPGLGVTSTLRPGDRGSYHSVGEAVDIAGSPATMNTAGAWIQSHLAGNLLEGIHNNTLSVKNGQPVSAMFWGPSTWAGHRNHIHLAAGGKAAVNVSSSATQAGKSSPGGTNIGSIFSPLARAQAQLGGLGGISFNPGMSSQATNTATGATAAAPPPTAGSRWSKAQLAALAMATGFPPGLVGTMAGIALAESGGNSSARHVNTNGSTDRGLWQINSIHGYGTSSFDPHANARQALSIFHSQGLGAWTTYNTGAYRSRMARGGRLNWGGWHAGGLDQVFNTPTMIGVGDGGAERVTVTPKGKRGAPGGVVFHNTFVIHGGHPGQVQAEIEAALAKFADELERHYGSDIGGVE